MEARGALRAAGVTAREAEVLACLGMRLTNAEVGERLHISVRTVESHVAALLRKLGEPDRRALAARAHDLVPAATARLAPAVREACEGPPLVGRVDALARLERAAARARTGGVRRLALVTGEAGIGKTRLAAEAALRCHAGGADVLHGRCSDDAPVPYQAIAEAIRPLLAGAPHPLTGPAGTGPDPALERYRRFEDVDRVLAAGPALVVLVLDDVQWMDASGVQLLRHLLARRDRSRLLVIATGRPEATSPHHRLGVTLAEADAAGALDVVELEGLDVAEAGELAEHLGLHGPGRAAAAWDRTRGNPFLLTVLLEHPAGHQALPPSARDAIVRRVAGLGPDAFDALSAAAVAGEAFDADDVAAVWGRGAPSSAGGIERAFGSGLVVEDAERPGRYRFTHAIVREALLAVLGPHQRARLHLGLAAALERRRPGALADRAVHRHAALPAGDPDLARDAALAAYDEALASLAFEVAAGFADMALDADAAGDGGRRAEIVVRRGRARLRAGDLQRALDDFQEGFALAEAAAASELAAHAALGWADASALWGRDPELLAALEVLLARGVADGSLRPRLKATLARLLYYEGQPERRRALAHDALADARAGGADEVLAAVLATTHASSWGPADLEERIGMARETVVLAGVARRPELELQGLGWLVADLLEAGDLAGTDAALRRHAAVAARLHHRLGRRDAELWSAMRATLGGRFDDAADRIERARDLGEAASDPAAESIYWVQRYWLAVERGRPAGLDALVEPCERIVAGNVDVPAWRAALAMLHARRGDAGAARVEFERLASDGFAAIPADVVWLNAMTYLAETCAFLGDAERARLLFRALEPYAERVAVIDRALACKGSIARFLGLLAATAGNRDGARRRLEVALARHERMRAGPLVERTRGELDALAPR